MILSVVGIKMLAAEWFKHLLGKNFNFYLLGFNFVGHPCLKRLLTHHEFKGYPLRKDYPMMAGQWCTVTSDLIDELNEPL